MEVFEATREEWKKRFDTGPRERYGATDKQIDAYMMFKEVKEFGGEQR